MVVVGVRLGRWLQMWVGDLLLTIRIHQFMEDTMVLLMKLERLLGLQVLLALVQLLEISSLRVVLVTGRDRGGASLDLLHLLEVELEGALFHVDVG